MEDSEHPGMYTSVYLSGSTAVPALPGVAVNTNTIMISNQYLTGVTVSRPRHGGYDQLSKSQMDRLMDHEFVPLEETGHQYCLICFAVDVYRVRTDHDYVIHED